MKACKDILRIFTTGSVDDGKSTLIGRLLFDSNKIFADQLGELERDCEKTGSAIDYAWLLDGLKAEREQGITIDVAYRYVDTEVRKFVIADTPGHEQYVRNMITGGSTADLAVIFVDASKGILTQTRRHTYLVSLLGIKHIVLAVNKMDLVDYDEQAFRMIEKNFRQFADKLGLNTIYCIPLSALKGDNVTTESSHMPWFNGKPFLKHIETVSVDRNYDKTSLRFPVQYVLRSSSFRGYCGKIAEGTIHKGDTVYILPSGKTSRVKQIFHCEKEINSASASQCVTLTLTDEIDLSRGEMVVFPDSKPLTNRNICAMLVWMDERPMNPNTSFFLKHTTHTTRARLRHIEYKVNVNTLERVYTKQLVLNDIACVKITCGEQLFFDSYARNRHTGAFILIDPVSNKTSAVGMIIDADESSDVTEIPINMEYTLNLSQLNIHPSNYEAVELICKELEKQGLIIRILRDL